jgi:hypothetical protein
VDVIFLVAEEITFWWLGLVLGKVANVKEIGDVLSWFYHVIGSHDLAVTRGVF